MMLERIYRNNDQTFGLMKSANNMNMPSIRDDAFNTIACSSETVRQLFLNASCQDRLFNICAFQIIRDHFVFRMGGEK